MSYKQNALPLSKGNTNLTTGSNGLGTYLCIEDGELSVTWSDDTVSTVTMISGVAVELSSQYCKAVSITSGTYHKA